MSIVCTFILQFYLNTLLMNKIGVCCLPSIVHAQYFSIIFNEKKCALYSIKYSIHLFIYAAVVVAVLLYINCNDNC
jgi:hypothetical protein